MAARLTESGLTTREQPIYRQQLLPLSDEASHAAEGDQPIIAPLFSPRTARQFADVWAGSAPLWLAAISEATVDVVSAALDGVVVTRIGGADRFETAVLVDRELTQRTGRLSGSRRASPISNEASCTNALNWPTVTGKRPR